MSDGVGIPLRDAGALEPWAWRSRNGLVLAAGAALLGVSIAAAPFVVAGVVLGAALLATVIRFPVAIVAAMLLIGPTDLAFLTGGERGLFRGLGGLDMNGVRLIAVTAGLGVAVIANPSGRAFLRSRWAILYVIFLAFAAARTVIASPDPIEGARLLVKLAYPLLFMVVVASLVRSREQLDRVGDLLLLGAALIAFVLNPIWFLEGGGFVWDVYAGVRAGGVGVHPSPFSLYLALVILYAFARLLARRQARYAILIVACAIWLVLTQSRSGMGALLGGLGVMGALAVVQQRSRHLTLAVIGAGVMLALFLVPVLVDRTFTNGIPTLGELLAVRYDPLRIVEYVNLSGREIFWPVVFDAFRAEPIFGGGLGTSTVVILAHFPPERGGVVHNEYLRLLADTGIVGMLLFAAATAMWLAGSIRAAGARVRMATEWALPAAGAVAAWAIASIADNGLDYYSAGGQLVGTLVGGALALGRVTSAGSAAAPPTAGFVSSPGGTR